MRIDADKIIEIASACIGTPFQHQARIPGVGIDCAGLLVHCFRSLDLDHHDELGYPRNPYDGMLEKILLSQPSLVKIGKSDIEAGDWLTMRIRTSPQHIALHAGFIGGHAYIIHASDQHKKVVKHRLDDMWRARITGAFRMERPE